MKTTMNKLHALLSHTGLNRYLWSYGAVLLTLMLSGRTLTAQSNYDFTVAHEEYLMFTHGESIGIGPSDSLGGLDLEGASVPIYGNKLYPNSTTPILVFGTGLLRLDEPNHNTAIDGLLMELRRLDDRSALLYQVDTVAGETIVKFEWRYAAILDTPDVPDDYVNFQIWLHGTSGIIELRYGPSKLEENYGETIGGGPFAGVFQSTPWDIAFIVEKKSWLTGDPMNPIYQDQNSQDLPRLTGVPADGTVYRFTPRASSSVYSPEMAEGEAGAYRIFPNPTSGKVRIEAREPSLKNARVNLIDVLGRTVGEYEMSPTSSTLEIDLPRPGVYYCEIVGENGSRIYRVVRQ